MMKTALRQIAYACDCEATAISNLLTVAIEALDAADHHIPAAHAEMALSSYQRAEQSRKDDVLSAISKHE
jgi:hypothetical protein